MQATNWLKIGPKRRIWSKGRVLLLVKLAVKKELKGLCQAICYIHHFKKLILSSFGINSVPKIIVQFCFVTLYLGTETSFLSRSVSTDGKDGHGLKIEKIGPNVSSLNASRPKKYIWFVLPDKMCLLIFSSYPTCISTGTVFERVKAVSNDFSEE